MNIFSAKRFIKREQEAPDWIWDIDGKEVFYHFEDKSLICISPNYPHSHYYIEDGWVEGDLVDKAGDRVFRMIRDNKIRDIAVTIG